MKIEFFTDNEGVHNARFPGDAYASNEAIFGIFYDYPAEYEARFLLEDIERVFCGDQKTGEFGDSINGEFNSEYAILRADDVKSKAYRLKTSDLKKIVKKWLAFRKRQESGIKEIVSIDVDVI